MPNLVVYVPAGLWKRIEELGLANPKVEARKVAVGALERYVTDGRLAERGPDLRESASQTGRADEALDADQRASLPRSASRPDDHFKPDFKK